jgi:GT2 family glycosyltransferase
MTKVAICIATRERPTEIAMLLESLMFQNYQDFDIFLLEDNPEGKSCLEFYFVNYLVTRLKLEGHLVYYERTQFNYGVSRARQRLADWVMEKGDYEYLARIDDDTILAKDYIERLMKLTDKYDIISGVTPVLTPCFIRDSKFINIADEFVIDKEGKILLDMDDCGYLYTDEKVVDCHHFRSCALIKKSVHEKVKYYPTKLSKHGFREETIFSLKALIEGFKIGVDLQAKAFHLNCQSGGERFPETMQMINLNKQVLTEWVKENKEAILKVLPTREVTKDEINRDNNLAR